MTSLILQRATRFLLPLMLLLSIFLLVRGHNEPGGGFTGGLVAAAAFALYALAYDVPAARAVLRFDPRSLIGGGLSIALFSGLWAWFFGEAFLTSQWSTVASPIFGEIEVGTPLFFDLGVYLVVIGVTLIIIFTLAEE